MKELVSKILDFVAACDGSSKGLKFKRTMFGRDAYS